MTLLPKTSTAYTSRSQTSTSYTGRDKGERENFSLLREDGGFLRTEAGGAILLSGGEVGTRYTAIAKS